MNSTPSLRPILGCWADKLKRKLTQTNNPKIKMKKQTKLITAFAAATAALALSANAASIGINIGPANVGDGTSPEHAQNNVLSSSTTAGAEVVQDNWNNLMGNGNITAPLVDDSGSLVTTTSIVSTQWGNGNVVLAGAELSDGDRLMMNGYMDNGGGAQGATVSGITYATYDVYIYQDGGNNNKSGTYQVLDASDDTVLASQNSYDRATFTGTYVEASSVGIGGTGLDINGDPINSNYIKFTGLTTTDIKIRATGFNLPGESTQRAGISGFQIVDAVPEPSTTALLGLGGLALIFRRRK
jgi:hypothetical protein